jgi:hypothetical protein
VFLEVNAGWRNPSTHDPGKEGVAVIGDITRRWTAIGVVASVVLIAPGAVQTQQASSRHADLITIFTPGGVLQDRNGDGVIDFVNARIVLGEKPRQKALLNEIIQKMNDLFKGGLSEQDKLVYVNNVIKGKLLESEKLVVQATNNTKEQFANSPDLKTEILNAVISALEAHTVMSTQALGSEAVREGLKDILLGPARLYETLREHAAAEKTP